MAKDELNDADAYHAAEYFIDKLKLKLVPMAVGTKDPKDKGWQKKTYNKKDFVGDFNIGIFTGHEVDKQAYFADVDIDMKLDDGTRAFPGAAEVVAELLSYPSGWVCGRASAPCSHLGYLTITPVTTKQYKGLKGKCLIELRGLAKKGTFMQTVIPPGEHKSKERLVFQVFDMNHFFASVLEAERLGLRVRAAAIALAILHVWPATGSRHDARLAFSKVLHEAGLADDDVVGILTAVTRATGGDVADVVDCFQDTIAKDPKDTIGAKWIIDQLSEGKDTLKVLDKMLGLTKAPEDSFDVTEIDLKTLTPAVWDRVRDTNDPVRQCLQGGVPVRIVHLPEVENKRRPTWVFQPLERDRLRNEVAKVTKFVYRSGKEYLQVAPPSHVIADMLATEPNHIKLPVVTRIIYAPILAPDGTVQLTAGYQQATGAFYVPDPRVIIPPVADRPTAGDVANAVAMIREPIQDFPFETESDRIHAIALYLLPFVRDFIDGPTPIHLVKKALYGEGATLLVDTLLHPAAGTDIAKITAVGSEDEWRKTITSVLLDGPMSVVIDNVNELLSSTLASAITSVTWQARILGVSRTAILPVQCVWAATGVSPTTTMEFQRRIVPIELNSNTERPWERSKFQIADLPSWSRDHRGDMIWAALTLARAWYVAGRPAGEASLGMFEDWARVVGGILKHAGFEGFLASLPDMYAGGDVEGDAVRWYYEEWLNHHGDKPIQISETAAWALAPGSPVLLLMSGNTDKALQTSFGLWVPKLKNRVVTVNRQLVRIEPVKVAGKTSRRTWRMATVSNLPLLITSPSSTPF